MSGFIGSGDVMLDIYINGAPSGAYLNPVNATVFSLASKGADTKERISKMRNTFGQVLDSVGTPNPHEIEMEFDDGSASIWALAFAGYMASFSQSGAAAQSVTKTLPLGKWVELGKYKVSNVSITGKTPGVDFEIKADAGMVRSLPGGSIADNASVNIDFDCALTSGEQIFAATRGSIDVRIKFDGLNQADKKPVIVDVFHAQINADSVLDFLADDFGKTKLSGKLITPAGMPHPYVITRLA